MPGEDRTFVRRADLLWAFSTADKEEQARIAAWLEFEAKPEQKPAPPATAQKLFDPSVTVQTESPPAPTQEKTRHKAYFRIKDRESTRPKNQPVDDVLALPDWFTQAKPTFLQETATRIPARHRVQPDDPPLLAGSRLFSFLQRELGALVTGHQPDVPRLVRQMANGAQVRRILRRQRFTWSPQVQVLVDINDSNFPYRKDFIQLQNQLKNWRGSEGLDIRFLYDAPGGKVSWYEQGREQVGNWRMPAREVPLLILSDLSLQGRSRRGLYQWLAFGQQLALNGIRPTVLLPVPARRVDKRLLRYFRCVVWDRNSDLRPVQAGEPVLINGAQADTQTQQLLALLFPVLRVELGLLRAIRYLLPAADYDVGHEAAVWGQSAVQRAGDEWGWLPESRGDYRRRFIKHFRALPELEQQALVQQLGCYHAQLPDELYFEAMAELMRLELPVPEDVQQATADFMAMMVKTYAVYPQDKGLHHWVKRYLQRHDHPEMHGVSAHQSAFMVLARRDELATRTQLEWPEGIPPEQLLPFMSMPQPAQHWELCQQGERLGLFPLGALTEDDWGYAATLLTLELTDSHVLLRYRNEQGEEKQQSLHLRPGIAESLPFPAGCDYRLLIGTETLHLEVTALNEKPAWAVLRGTDAQGTWVKTRLNEDSRYYWHPPVWESAEGLFPGFWYPTPDLPTPNWADTLARDTYGLYADTLLADIPQRFRWIEPTQFLMGSPQDEPGRYSDETQHLVTLTQGYWLADTTCTQAVWRAVMGENPSAFKGEDKPVDAVSWQDIEKFLSKLNKNQPELKLQLPTEVQWENACRSGTTTEFSFGGKDDLSLDKVNYSGKWDDINSNGQTKPVKSYAPNQWGLYEMHGNVLEWCQDWFGSFSEEAVIDPFGTKTGELRVLRGGSWIDSGEYCRSANRNRHVPGVRVNRYGFRLARGHELPASSVRQDSVAPSPPGPLSQRARGSKN